MEIIILGIPLAMGIVTLIILTSIIFFNRLLPQALWTWHVKRIKKGKYQKVERKDYDIIKTRFIDVTIFKEKDIIYLDVWSSYYDLFEIEYDLKNNQMIHFSCSPIWKKKIKKEVLISRLPHYVRLLVQSEKQGLFKRFL